METELQVNQQKEPNSEWASGLFNGDRYPLHYHFRLDIPEPYNGQVVGYSRFSAQNTLGAPDLTGRYTTIASNYKPTLLIWQDGNVIESRSNTFCDQEYPAAYHIDPESFFIPIDQLSANTIVGHIPSKRPFLAEALLKWNGKKLVECHTYTFEGHVLELHQLIFPEFLDRSKKQGLRNYTMIGVSFGPSAHLPITYLYWIDGEIRMHGKLSNCPDFQLLFNDQDRTINYPFRLETKPGKRPINGISKTASDHYKQMHKR